MNKFTKGPWFTWGIKPGRTIYVEAQLDCGLVQEICAIGPTLDPDHQEANARLIMAAPEMIEELQNLENDAGQIPDHAWKLVQNAIRKATTIQ